MSVGWVFALALALDVANAAEPARTPLVDELVRVLTAAREARYGPVIVRF